MVLWLVNRDKRRVSKSQSVFRVLAVLGPHKIEAKNEDQQS